ncbi:MAG: HDOD domain-containing protein [Chthoniobacteraceae bacterium]
MAAIVAEDPSMTAKMLQLVNSPFFGYSRKISNAVEAVTFLGMASIRTLAISSHMVEAFRDVGARGFSLGRVWNHSMATALAAQKIARFLGGRPEDISNAYTAGMLHDIGKLMMASNLPGEYSEAVGIARAEGIPMAEAERQVFGASHAEIGAYLLGLWGLPVPIVEAVAFHHRITEEHLWLLPLVAVHTASALENKVSSPMDKLVMQTVARCIPEPLEAEAMNITREALSERMRAQAA